jgi:hypothetical protein
VTYGALGTVLIVQSWLIGVGWVVYGGQLCGRWFNDAWLRDWAGNRWGGNRRSECRIPGYPEEAPQRPPEGIRNED